MPQLPTYIARTRTNLTGGGVAGALGAWRRFRGRRTRFQFWLEFIVIQFLRVPHYLLHCVYSLWRPLAAINCRGAQDSRLHQGGNATSVWKSGVCVAWQLIAARGPRLRW